MEQWASIKGQVFSVQKLCNLCLLIIGVFHDLSEDPPYSGTSEACPRRRDVYLVVRETLRVLVQMGAGDAQAELREQQTGSDFHLSGRADLSPWDSTLSGDSTW